MIDGREGSDKARQEERPSRAPVAAAATSLAVAGAAALVVGLNQAGNGRRAIPDGSVLVNGTTHLVESDPGTPLLYVLRDELGITGPKFGCGLAQCGACAVLVGGKEARSCVTAWDAVRDEVTTLEGLPARWAAQAKTDTAALHPVQQAWIDEQVPQCGYCQSGMMIMAVDLLSRIPRPTVAQIRDAFTNTPPSPHLCRCGTYQSVIRAIQRAARLM